MDNFNNQNSYNQNNYNGMNNTFNQSVGQGSAPDYMLWLILGIVQICLICCCNIFSCVCGIITVIMAVQANNYFKYGNYTMYQARIKSAKIANIIGWALIVVSIVLNIVTGVFSTIANSL